MRSTAAIHRIPALLGVAALLTASLAACTAAPGFGGCEPKYDDGPASSVVTADGKVGSSPDVDFPTPLVAGSAPEAHVIERGDGDLIEYGSQVDYQFTLFNGETGDAVGDSGYDAEQFSRMAVRPDVAAGEALACATVGSRVAVVSTWGDTSGAFDPDSEGSIDPDATVVVVIDVVATYLGKADGFNQLPVDGYPTVATEMDGTPGIRVPAEDPPKTSGFGVIKAGDGQKVKADDAVVTHFTLWTWPTKVGEAPVQVASNWAGYAAAQTLTATSVADGGGLPDGIIDALIGQRVGSQILIILAPGDGSFTAETAPAGADATYILVVDLLGVEE